VSPAGVAPSGKTNDELFWAVRVAAFYNITPMSLLRFAGPFGLSLMQWILKRRIQWVPETNIIRSGDMDFDDISLYSYHNWALKSSGDRALYTHLHPGALAQRRPLEDIFKPHRTSVPLTFLFGGGGDWMPSERAQAIVRSVEKTQYAVFRLVPIAGHQVFMDNPSDFNQMVIDAIHDQERAVASGFTATPL
jgi:abhydrolase domain-containing protein 5